MKIYRARRKKCKPDLEFDVHKLVDKIWNIRDLVLCDEMEETIIYCFYYDIVVEKINIKIFVSCVEWYLLML